MESYSSLVAAVAKTVDQFTEENVTPNQARDWLAPRYPAEVAMCRRPARNPCRRCAARRSVEAGLARRLRHRGRRADQRAAGTAPAAAGAHPVGGERDSCSPPSAHLFKQLTGIDATIVTYRVTPDLITGVMRGDIDVAFDYYAAFKGSLTGNKLRILASADEERNPILPDVPTVKELGIPDYVVTSWNALSAPAGLPQDILAVLNRDIVAALADPELKKKALDLGLNAQGSTPEAMRERMERDIKRWAAVIEKAGIPKQ